MSLLEQKITQIPHPYVVVCEGMGDVRLIGALLKLRGITNCNVGCPSTTGGHGSGNSAIPNYLKNIQALIQAGKANLNGLLVVADSDLNTQDCFLSMSAALQDSGFPVPSRAFSIEGTPLKTAIFIMPGEGKTGTLEHLLWDAAIDKNPKLKKCVDRFCRCTGGRINSASDNAKAKMQMSAIVAAHCQGNPWASPAMLWSQPDNPVPISSRHFDPIADFLATFTT